MINTNNLYQARETDTQRYNIYNMLMTALNNNKGVLRLDTSSKKDWFRGLHPTTKQAFLSTCSMHGIKIVN